ncbi:hypothetical protein DFA_03260 [Cavenderia fasciculata]|uniref:Carbohydrate binding domain-containing protein n=1 Tax=Cavenderia fasciculata TaxID=261658 RepID=F4PH30_CACFS|nr:uncharacterized protein DFA_03260 [Cavenderia fasciculata]EGG25014.1 hypothetical protein DFA_03260 [Cavenderia fasciculata]|eukprot:XP_004362865.1 hypothetical protein DFA_03260 [Cavenderia fasciculata]
MFKQILIATVLIVAFSAISCNSLQIAPTCSSCYLSMDTSIYYLNKMINNGGAPAGTSFNITMKYYGNIQAGVAQVTVYSPSGSPMVISQRLLVNFDGSDDMNFQINSSPTSDTGSYQITSLICAESCQSNDNNAQVLDKSSETFQIFPSHHINN